MAKQKASNDNKVSNAIDSGSMLAKVEAKQERDAKAASIQTNRNLQNIDRASKEGKKAWFDKLEAMPISQRIDQFIESLTSSARETVANVTKLAENVVRTHYQNMCALADRVLAVEDLILDEEYVFWVSNILPGIGMKRSMLFPLVSRARIAKATFPYDPAREAATNLIGLSKIFVSVDGDFKLSDAADKAFRPNRYPVPTIGTYAECCDWAKHVAVFIQQVDAGSKLDPNTLFAAAYSSFRKLIEGTKKGGKQVLSAQPVLAVRLLIDIFNEINRLHPALIDVAETRMGDPLWDKVPNYGHLLTDDVVAALSGKTPPTPITRRQEETKQA